MAAGTLALLSHATGAASTAGNGLSEAPALSADGNFVAFASRATLPGRTGPSSRPAAGS